MRTILLFIVVFLVMIACGQKTTEPAAGPETEPVTPVTVTSVTVGELRDEIELNATSAFLVKHAVKANLNGYIRVTQAQPGQFVREGQALFTLKTKESESLGDALAKLDTTLHFTGESVVHASAAGFITALDHQTGDYVQDGEQLATLSDAASFAFLLELPYELKPYLPGNRRLTLSLPDGTVLAGMTDRAFPTVDPVSQTQNIVIHVGQQRDIPENLIAKVLLVKQAKHRAVSLPKAAVLTDEAQSEFWVMKMTDDSTAVKIPVTLGLQTAGRVEILSPPLHPGDRILLTGNFGLPDTARVGLVE